MNSRILKMRYSLLIKFCDEKSQGIYHDFAFEFGCDGLENIIR